MSDSLYQLGRQLRDGSLSARDLADQCLERLQKSEPSLNAYTLPAPDLCRTIANAADSVFRCGTDPGPLAGIPVSVKDLYSVTGLKTCAGSPNAIPAEMDLQGPLIDQLRQQFGAITGKTHTVEFAFGGLGVNSHRGTPVNPWDAKTHRVPGGSSSGAGVSLIQGSAMVALGTDTAGSVRIPASMTGTVGLKTSAGRWPLKGIFPLSPTLDTAGVLARSVEDVAFAFAALDPLITDSPWEFVDRLRNSFQGNPTLALGEPLLWDHCSNDISSLNSRVLSSLSHKGLKLVDAALPETVDARKLLHQGNVISAELAEFLAAEMPTWLETLDPLVGARIRDGGAISAGEWLGRQRRLKRISASAAERFRNFDLMVCPTVPVTPPPVAEVAEIESYRPVNMACLSNTCIANSLSLCALTLPVGLDEAGMPVGMQLLAPLFQEERLLATALWIEDHIGKPGELLGNAPGAE